MTESESFLDLRVVVFAADPEILDGLADYLRAAGARALPRRELRVVEASDVIVLFSDDFDDTAAEEFVRDWGSANGSGSVLVLVTGQQRIADAVRTHERAVVLRRPVWGWVLLGAIRSVLGDLAHTRAARLPT